MTTVLVVEDSPTLRKSLVRLLESDPDIQVVGEADNGLTATRLAARLKPDLITMDVMMPEMDGLEATRRIMRRSPTKILIVTAHGNSPDLNVAFEAMQAGALDVIGKSEAPGTAAGDWERDFLRKVSELAAAEVRWE